MQRIQGIKNRKKICRKLAALICVLTLSAGIAGCAEKKTAQGNESAVDMQVLQESMLAADTTLPEMKVATSDDEQAELNFSAFSDFEYDRVQSYFYAYAADGGTQEVAVVQLKDAGDAAALMNTLKDHLEDRRGALTAYAPDQLPLVDHAVIKQKGALVTMIISEKSGLIQQAFEAE
ncbi:MAG: DUF4358 domain-containing protein [Eubacterium sp.]|nr:DUF4358 domain-containing protein [Eubacterium sp.]